MTRQFPTIPLDLDTACAVQDWRRTLSWPVSIADMRAASRRSGVALAELIASSRAEDRSTLLLAGPLLMFFARQLVDAALAIDGATRRSALAVGAGKVARVLSGDKDLEQPLANEWMDWRRESPVKWLALRRVGRVASWSSPLKTVRALVKPDAIAVSHNSLLVATASRSRLSVGFDHAEQLLSRLCSRGGVRPPKAPLLADGLVNAAMAVPGLREERRDCIGRVLRPLAADLVERAQHDLSALEGFRLGAPALWSATGGRWAPRALGLAAIEQGYTVRRFEHVGTGCLIADGLGFDMTERAVSTEVVVPTPDLARFAERIRTKSLEPLATLIPGDGDPAFVFPAVSRPRATKPRVVYATTILRRYMQYHDGLLSDPIYLDWQLRVAEALGGLPVEAKIKPHPESHYPGGVNPLEGTGMLSKAPFEALIPETDVFIFDFGQTTTFWKGLATAQPVVYLDLGLTAFQDEVRAALAQRATVVPVAYDDRNRPILDCEALADAIASAKPAGEDNPFRRWLGGAA